MPFHDFITEFGIIAVVHFLAVASPGPDFAVIVKQSLTRGRAAALATSAGIGCGILIHVTYSIVGIGLLIANSPVLLTWLTYVAGAYLFYIGIQGIRAKPIRLNESADEKLHRSVLKQSKLKSFITGFLVNGLNIKATLFFVSLFSVVIATTTPVMIQALYGAYMAIATFAWFSFLSIVLTVQGVQQTLLTKSYIIDRVMGIILIVLAFSLVI